MYEGTATGTATATATAGSIVRPVLVALVAVQSGWVDVGGWWWRGGNALPNIMALAMPACRNRLH